MRIAYSIVGLAAAVVFAAAPACALDLVEGGFGTVAPEESTSGLSLDAPMVAPLFTGAEAGSTIGFTPRSNIGAYSGRWQDRVALRLDVNPTFGNRFGFAADNFQKSANSNMLVGGALELDDFALTGGVGRTTLFGGTAEFFSAGMALGGVSANLAFGETVEEVQGERDVMMLSTDLAISSWITLQGDVALTETVDEREPLAIGRVGVRLRF